MRHILRGYQDIVVRDAADFLASGGHRRFYSAPTGSGKSIIELAIQEQHPGSWIITPRLEIVEGLLDKLGAPVPATESATVEEALSRSIITPIRFRNLLLSGRVDPPALLIVDEAHHDEAETYRQLRLLVDCPALGFSATPYRGTPSGTVALRETWGEPVAILTYAEATRLGVISIPSCVTLPLVDDDLVEVQSGELQASVCGDLATPRLHELALWCSDHCGGAWNAPTLFACPTVECARLLASELNAVRMPAVSLTGEASRAERRLAFTQCVDNRAAIVQVGVVSEGVDLPVRLLIDLAPTLSPVRWVQQLGRATRPGGGPTYVCTNRNLMRHGYLLDGCLPPSVLADSQAAFGGAGRRAACRTLGLEALGRLRGAELPLRGGLRAVCYSVSAMDGHQRVDYFVLVHPCRADPVWATRRRQAGEWPRWSACAAPEDLHGFASTPPRDLTEKQAAWWKRQAGRYGLDPTAEVTSKVFQALPVLADLGGKL